MRGPPGYIEVALCGHGATSRVFRAIEARSGHVVALKRLHRQLLHSDEGLARVRREFEALSRLHHPGLVAVRDVLRWQGDPTVVMDFIEGQDLDRRIAEQGTISVDFAGKLAKSLLRMLAAAHGAGIVHRDVKPQNVRVDLDGGLHLLDFGSARFDASSQLTATGTSVGTPDYMAPELFAGSAYDPRVDLYGVGATLYKALTGQPPQVADSLTELAFRRTKEPIAPIRSLRDDVPQGLAQVIDRCLERAPSDRYASCRLALWALDNPQAELSFQSRRRSLPPCLHCGAGLAPASVLCPQCGSDHPFAYSPGSHHVDLHNVKRPEQFAHWWAQRFPERAQEPHLDHLCQRLSALQQDSQRLVSFIDEREAQAIADELQSQGVQCEVVMDQGTSGWRLYALSMALLVAGLVVFGHGVLGADIGWHHGLLLVLPAVAALMAERVLSVARGAQGMLSSGRYPAAVVPNLRAGLMLGSGGLAAASVLAPSVGSALAGAGATAAAAAVSALHLPLWVGALGSAGAAVFAWSAGFRNAVVPSSSAAEPGALTKLRQALSIPRGLSGRRLRTETAVLLTASVLALVPAELAAVSALSQWVPSVPAMLSSAPAVATVPSAAAATPALPAAAAPVLPQAGLSPVPAPAVSLAPAAVATAAGASAVAALPTPVGLPFWAWVLTGLFGVSSLAVVSHILTRRRRLLVDAGQMKALLSTFELQEGRRAPVRRLSDGLSAADSVALVPSCDDFLLQARTRATDLAHCLDEEGAGRLRRALERATGSALGPAGPGSSAIGPLDPDQELRFEFLALEGELEASAAAAWWQAVPEEDES